MPQSSAISFAIRTQKKLGLNWLRKVPRLPTIGLPSGLYATAHLYYDLKFLLELEARECEPNGSPIFLHEFLKQTSPLYRRIFELADILDISMEPKFVSRMRFIEEYDPYRKSVLAPIVREELEWLLNEPLQTGMLGTLSDLLRHNFPVYHEVTHAIFNRLVSFSCKGLSTRASNDYFLFIECLVGAQEALVAEQLGGFIGDSLHKANSTYRKVSDGRLARVYKPSILELSSSIMTHLGSIHGLSKQQMKTKLPAWAPFDNREIVGYHQEFFVKELQPRWLKKNRCRKPDAKKAVLTGLPMLELAQFGLDHFLNNPQLMNRICVWLSEVFGYSELSH